MALPRQQRPEGLYWHAAREVCAAALECRDRARGRPNPLPTSVLQHLQSELWAACEDAALHGEIGADTASHSARALLLMFEFILDHVDHVERERDRALEDLQSAISAMKKWRAREEMQQRKVTELQLTIRGEATGAAALEEEVARLREELHRVRGELEQQARITAAHQLRSSRVSAGPIFPVSPPFESDPTSSLLRSRAQSLPASARATVPVFHATREDVEARDLANDGSEEEIEEKELMDTLQAARDKFKTYSGKKSSISLGYESESKTGGGSVERSSIGSKFRNDFGHASSDPAIDDFLSRWGTPSRIDADGWLSWDEKCAGCNDHASESPRDSPDSQEVAEAVRTRMQRILSET